MKNVNISVWLKNVFLPYEFTSIRDTMTFIKQTSMGITHGITKIEKDTEHLSIRCPVSGEYLDITASTSTLNLLDRELERQHMYIT